MTITRKFFASVGHAFEHAGKTNGNWKTSTVDRHPQLFKAEFGRQGRFWPTSAITAPSETVATCRPFQIKISPAELAAARASNIGVGQLKVFSHVAQQKLRRRLCRMVRLNLTPSMKKHLTGVLTHAGRECCAAVARKAVASAAKRRSAKNAKCGSPPLVRMSGVC